MISSTAPLMPASSPSLRSSISISKPFRSAQRVYMRMSISRPVLRLGAAGAGGDFDLRVAEVVAPAQQRAQLERVELLGDALDLAIELARHPRRRLRSPAARASSRAERTRASSASNGSIHPLSDLDLLHDVARMVLVVPERAVRHLALVRSSASSAWLDVKDTSACPRAVPLPAPASAARSPSCMSSLHVRREPPSAGESGSATTSGCVSKS